MVLTQEELIGKLQPEVRILPANDSPGVWGRNRWRAGVGKPGDGGSRAQSGRHQGSNCHQPKLFTELVSSFPDNHLRAMMETSGQKASRASFT
jgi:hypothetical protein